MADSNGDDNNAAPEWKNSAARDCLYDMVVDGVIPGKDDITPKEVFEKYCKHLDEFKHFQDYKELNFASKLRATRERAAKKSSRSKEDAEFLAHDRQIFAAPVMDTKGFAMWKGSKAQELLRKAIDKGEHEKKKPKVLYEEEAEWYENYTLDYFRDRIYQEIKFNKRQVFVKEKAEAAAEKAATKK
jgi:hypothetical protein